MVRPLCTPLEVSATYEAGEGMALLWYKDGLPFVVPSADAAASSSSSLLTTTMTTTRADKQDAATATGLLGAGYGLHFGDVGGGVVGGVGGGDDDSVIVHTPSGPAPQVATFTLANEQFVASTLKSLNGYEDDADVSGGGEGGEGV